MRKLAALLLCLMLTVGVCACGNNGKSESINGTLTAAADVNYGFKQTTASDDYGHEFSAVTDYNENVVGIFYFLWLSQAANTANISQYEESGEAESTLTGSAVPMGPSFTWWGEPMYGYYQVEDEWVVRKHVELFINAGLDFICFDTTNNDYYQRAAKTVLDVLLEYKTAGYDVPGAMFMTNSYTTEMTENIYNAFYANGKYDSVWFYGKGYKPWIISGYAGDNTAIKSRFYFKAAQWPTYTFDTNKFPWMSWKYPQETFTDASGYNIMNVSVSQHIGLRYSVNFSLSGLFAPYNRDTLSDELKNSYSARADEFYNRNWGRGYSHSTEVNNIDDAIKNVNFDEQWQTVFDNSNINLVFITGWNEWIAQKQSKDPILGSSYGYYVDTYNFEFSRDVEMMTGGYLDNCYIQMAAQIRAYKGAGAAATQSVTQSSVDLLNMANWSDVPAYYDLSGETEERAHMGAGGTYYTNDTGRNDIIQTRVAHTNSDIYVLIQTKDAITEKAADDTRWMNLFIGVNGGEGGFNGLNYVINRQLSGTAASVDKIQNNAFVSAGNCTTLVSGNLMLVKIPKSVLGISGNEFTLNFKVCDNLQKDFDITDLYTNGDCAPIGRINYVYSAK